MALIYCPKCGTQVSEHAVQCLKCGYAISERQNSNEEQKTDALASNTLEDGDIIERRRPPTFVIIAGIIFLVTFLIIKISNNNNNDHQQDFATPTSTNSTNENSSNVIYNQCSICGRKFTGNGFEEVSEGVWKPCQEPYQCYICSQECGMKHTAQMNALLNKLGGVGNNNGGGYITGSDGRIYESNVCPLCKGTGIEKNQSSLSDEYGRICPMCGGKGVRSY
jgi:hypothetical protein